MSNQGLTVLNRMIGPKTQVYRPGVLQRVVRQVADAEEARRQLLTFGGRGWFQDVTSCRLVLSGEEWQGAGATILQAEAVKGNQSLHVRNTDGRWEIISLTETDDPAGILRSESFVSTDERWRLLYTVSYSLEAMDGHDEWRPYAYRLCDIEETHHA
ncbi:MAG TPA: hypothetical protein PKE26_05235 [Kiritimatiellia bacterium]|nr:hypothetical protein [Kiritimatiellia bacterium]HMO98496.1 hypothetical protein [Kiritimatiellia bacterium]HMP95804.1 hypothetical protein [Kiritimatiellia bacterium]